MSKEKKTGILVGASPLGAEVSLLKELLNNSDVISVAADGGLSFFVQESIRPDYWLGDRDSLPESLFEKAGLLFPDLELTPCAREKDDTDMRLAMLKCVECKATEVYIFGGLGGDRFDHGISNIQLLHEFALQGVRVFLISEKEYLYVLTKGEKVVYDQSSNGILSIFSLTDETSLSIRDLRYEFDGKINNRKVFTVSNEFNQKGGTVEVFEGTALIVRPVFYAEDRNRISFL